MGNLQLILVNILNGLVITIVMMVTTMQHVVGMAVIAVGIMLIHNFALLANVWIQMEEAMEQLNHQPNLQLNLQLILVNILNGLVITIVMMVTTMKNVAGMVETAVELM